MRNSGISLRLLAGCIPLVTTIAALAVAPPKSVHHIVASPGYNRDIRPILSDTCFPCHGPDSAKRKAGLRLDIRDAAIKQKAIIPGTLGGSLWNRITQTSPDLLMPPPGAHKPLSKEQKETIKAWLLAGAKYEPHWAYTPITKPPVPPTVARRSPIDAFIDQRLKQLRIPPAPPADPVTLIRRVSLDLTGLPPNPDDLKSYVSNPTPQAFSAYVDRLLVSYAHAERMSVWWLDQVRYADTVGFHGDQNHNAWPYRDWVIDAFKANIPYTTFVRDQLAGDLIPGANDASRTATCFNRLNMVTREGGAQPGEYLAKYAADRVRTVGSAFLGSTIACAECHDHKYDPFTAKDFYSIAAYFADMRQWGVYADYSYTPEPELRGINNDSPFPPEIIVGSKALNSRIREELAGLKSLAAGVPESDPRFMAFTTKCAQFRDINGELAPVVVESPTGSVWHTPVKSAVNIDIPRSAVMLAGIEVTLRQPVATTTVTTTLKQGTTTLSFWHGAGNPHTPSTQNGFEKIGIQGGWRITGKSSQTDAKAVYWLARTAYTSAGPLKLTLSGVTSDVRIRVIPVHAITPDSVDAPLVRDAKMAFLLSGAGLERVSDEVNERLKNIVQCRGGRTPVMVTEGTSKPRQARVLARGNWMDTTGQIVGPGTPAFLTPGIPNNTQPSSRLELAAWITTRANPLTARVLVNRFWRLFFGAGISQSVEDFGAQGEAPSNPALLDWMASTFMERGWNMRSIIREIVLSDAYKRSSRPLSVHIAKDPQNRTFARQTPRRLEAEFIRDNALSIAGILDTHVGGPPVKPFQPAGYYANLQFPDRDYIPSTRGDQYRRGLYTHWQRTFLHPGLAAFDAPSREEACPLRTEANTPQQALTLLNDPVYVEAARGLANLMYATLKPGSGTVDDRLNWLMRRVRGTPASATERKQLKVILAESHQTYTINEVPGREMLRTGSLPSRMDVDPIELAAYTNVCRVLLNLHETITRY
ncbi:MAG: PSD1 and planctomycete cytochrome C domain-containing protein [Armatimonadota bacterium]